MGLSASMHKNFIRFQNKPKLVHILKFVFQNSIYYTFLVMILVNLDILLLSTDRFNYSNM